MALYATDLIKKNDVFSALKLFTIYGAPANPQNFNIYKALCQMVFNGEGIQPSADMYRIYANLRNVLHQVVSNGKNLLMYAYTNIMCNHIHYIKGFDNIFSSFSCVMHFYFYFPW